jgi:hypothetical protein
MKQPPTLANYPGRLALVTACCATALGSVFAQSTLSLEGHYVPGVEGLNAGTLPPPGIYLRDYNRVYWANRLNDSGGHEIAVPGGFHATAYANVPRAIWITDFKLLGANYGMDALIPLVYQDVRGLGSKFSTGDACFEPLTLSWHGDQYDISAAYAFYAPTGPMGVLEAGQGFWTQMLTLGGTWYAQERSWSFSVLNRYEFNSIQRNTGIRPGQVWTLEYGIGKNLTPACEVGLVGYYQLQTTGDSGPWPVTSGVRDSGAGIGPEVTYAWPKIMLFASLRYEYEFFSKDRAQGNIVNLTLTKKF